MITSGEDIKCSECGGEGTVEWEYSDKNDRSYLEYSTVLFATVADTLSIPKNILLAAWFLIRKVR